MTRRILLSPVEGAATTLHVATAPEGATTTGTYFARSVPAEHELSRLAQDDDLAARLWAASEELVGPT